MKDISRNLTMLVDYYELTMGNGYFRKDMKDKIAYFDVFYRKNPDDGGYAIVAGLEQVVEYINDLHFDSEDINYLRRRGCFEEDFLDYLRGFHFTGDIWAVPEGTVVFPGEPLMTVRAPAIDKTKVAEVGIESALLTAGQPLVVLASGLDQDAQLTVHGMKGQLLLGTTVTAGTERMAVGLEELKPGVYIYSIKSATQRFFGQFIIK